MYDSVTQIQSNYSATVCVDTHRLPKGRVHVYMYDTVPRSRVTIVPQYVRTPIGYLKVQYNHVCMIRSPRSRVTIVPQYVWTSIGYLKVEYIYMYDTVTQIQSNYSATVCVDTHRLPKGTVHIYMYDTVTQIRSNYSATVCVDTHRLPKGTVHIYMYDTVTHVQSNFSATVCV